MRMLCEGGKLKSKKAMHYKRKIYWKLRESSNLHMRRIFALRVAGKSKPRFFTMRETVKSRLGTRKKLCKSLAELSGGVKKF